MDEPSGDARSPMERAANDALKNLSQAPPLTLLAVVGGLFELALARVAWHGLSDVVEVEALRQLRDLARFPRNLAAVSGTLALVVALLAFLRLPGFAGIGRRLAVAAFSGIFVPSVIVATALPAATLRRRLVIFGLAAANVLVTLLAMTAVRYRPHRGMRFLVGFVAATGFLSLAVVGLAQLVAVEGGPWAWLGVLFASHPSTTQRVLLGIRHLGEVSWLGAIFCGAWVVVDHQGEKRRSRAIAFVLLFLVFTGLWLTLHQIVGHRFRLMLFGAFRVGLFLDELSVGYALPLGAGLAGATLAIADRRGAIRQLGAGLLLWILAGYAPHTPIQLLYLVLGAVVLTRAAQALDPDGEWRTRQPWSRFLGTAR